MSLGLPVAVLSALMFGTADFMGGLASRRASAIMVTLVVSVVGAIPVLVLSGFVPGTPARADLLWGAAAGAFGATGVTLLYEVLARGPVGVVAPIAAVIGVSVPVLAGFAMGDRLSALALLGIALAVPAVALVSASGGAGARRATSGVIVAAVLAGLGLGAFLVCLARVAPGAGLSPLLAARATGAVIALLAMRVRGVPFGLPSGARVTGVACALVDGLANVLYLLVARGHAVSIVGTIVSLAPALTVLLGRVVLHERFHRLQVAGLLLAAVAVVLLTTH